MYMNNFMNYNEYYLPTDKYIWYLIIILRFVQTFIVHLIFIFMTGNNASSYNYIWYVLAVMLLLQF